MDVKQELESLISVKKRLDLVSKAILGSEYLIVLTDFQMNLISGLHPYICVLCYKEGDFTNMLNHLTSVPHRKKFLSKHFPSTSSALELKNNGCQYQFNELLSNLCEEIETRCGRLMPYITTTKKYLHEVNSILRDIGMGQHFFEKPHSSVLMDLITKAKINVDITGIKKKSCEPERNKNRYQNPYLYTERAKTPPKKFRKSPSPSTSQSYLKLSTRQKKSSKNAKNFISPKKQPIYVPNSVVEYRRILTEKTDRISNKYNRVYSNFPENHPKFAEEWNQFFIKELNVANKKRLPKPSLEIIKKKWKNFFTNRLKELEEEENLQTRIDLRNQMDLPIDSVDIEKLKSIEVKAKTLMEENSSSKPKEIQSSSSAQTRKRLFKVEKVETYELKPIKSEPGTLKSPESSKKPKLKPIVDLEELSTELSSKVEAFSGGRKSFNNSKADSGLASNDDSLPSPSESLASTPNVYNLGTNLFQNSDIITLFGAYSMLSTEMQSHLTEIMNEIEKTDPERYVFLTNSQIDDSEGFEDEDNLEAAKLVAAEITDPPLKSQAVELESDDDDDYQLEDSVLLKRVLENSKTVEILDDSDGDEPVELVDLTAY